MLWLLPEKPKEQVPPVKTEETEKKPFDGSTGRRTDIFDMSSKSRKKENNDS